MNRLGRPGSTSPTPLRPILSASSTRPRKTSSRSTLTWPIPACRSSAAQRTRRASSCSAITASTETARPCWPTKRISTSMCWTSTPTMLVANSNDSCASFRCAGNSHVSCFPFFRSRPPLTLVLALREQEFAIVGLQVEHLPRVVVEADHARQFAVKVGSSGRRTRRIFSLTLSAWLYSLR